jgi:N-acylneuraminate cytidylyltransferase
MVNRPEVLAIVQARGGSKGLPNKNLRDLDGHPLLAYSIASALAAKHVTRTILSTDSVAIADTARAYGAEVPFMRPAELAEDDTPDFPLFTHALHWLAEHENYRPELVVQLRPTTPLRPRGMVDRAIEIMLKDHAADCVRGVTPPKQTPYKMWRIGEDGCLLPLLQTEFAEPYNMPRQKLPPTFWQTGHIDVIRSTTILQKKSLTGNRVRPILVDPCYCVDIDTAEDLDSAAQALAEGKLEIDCPSPLKPMPDSIWPEKIELVVFDFDGVFTDNRVIVLQDGREAVVCHRGDGMGISMLHRHGVKMLVLSTETNASVAARCNKLKLECVQGVANKLERLKGIAADRGLPLSNIAYVGNDVNDLECMRAVGLAVVPADAHSDVVPHAQLMLKNRGGVGAVREFCDLVILHFKKDSFHVTRS